MEIWKKIDGYDGRYSISNFGNIKTNAYINKHAVYGSAKHKELLRNPLPAARGYLRTVLTDINKKQHYIQIHRLVAQAFIPNPNGLPQVNHKDCNKKNNRADNLEWCTNDENRNHAKEMGLIKSRDQLPQSKLKSHQIPVLISLINSGLSQKKVGLIFGICQQNVSRIIKSQQ